jgi:hypothetical protein
MMLGFVMFGMVVDFRYGRLRLLVHVPSLARSAVANAEAVDTPDETILRP